MLPIIWVPGHLCGAWLYAPQLAVFGGERQMIVADTNSDDNLGDMAERLLAAAPERFVLAGLSMGGIVAMEVLARAPERVAGCGIRRPRVIPPRRSRVVRAHHAPPPP